MTLASLKRPAGRVLGIAALMLVLVGLWELYRWIWSSAGWTWPFVVGVLWCGCGELDAELS